MPPRSQDPGRPQLTLRDVAEAARVSEMTVSRVLRNRGDVSQATRARVLEAARSLGYVPNKIAGALASSRVNLVGVVIPSLSNMVFPQVLAGISDVLDDTPLQPVFGATHYKPEREEEVIYEMLSWRPSGMIVAGIEHSEASVAMLANSGIPVVEIMDADGDPIDAMVGISHRAAGARMAKEILLRGYRRIGFMGTKMPLDYRARKRLEGFEAVLNEAGVDLVDRIFYSGGSGLGKGREMTQEMLTRHSDLDFLYYSNDMIGAGGLLYCLEKGIRIPQDLGLAGFNAVEILDGLPMRLATMDTRRLEIGRAAAQIIAARVAGESCDQIITMDAGFDPGDTMRDPV
ncbi:LacI family DNA-binding transcriptional regulator [Nioella sp. MMSF_3534]|uniref:LacI family DNA-binding transcriptional regulator n=1 Tax=Nioella sp. MMSF_3534 TaxID=3046720 RepID=UPI00273E99CB|nr:LacI family DNA-binding transcriptional regulator [Nioella sp. MMSF_3534]